MVLYNYLQKLYGGTGCGNEFYPCVQVNKNVFLNGQTTARPFLDCWRNIFIGPQDGIVTGGTKLTSAQGNIGVGHGTMQNM